MPTRKNTGELITKLFGVENPSDEQVSSLLNWYEENSKKAIETAVGNAKEELTQSITTEISAKYKDYKSAEDYGKLETELNTLKDTNAKNGRHAKLKAKGIADKWLEFADEKIGKDETDYEKRVDDFVKNNAELLVKGGNSNPFYFGGSNNDGKALQNANARINAVIRGEQ